MNSSVVLAVDIGTTSVKTLAVDEEGNVLGSGSVEYTLYTPQAQIAEQDPDEIFAAVGRSVYTVMKKMALQPGDVLCVSLSAAMHSLIAVDEAGRPLSRSMTWADQRGAAQAARLAADGSGLAVYLRTGTPIHAMSPFVKLLWLRETTPDLFYKAKRWIGIKEYILHRLFGRYVVDHSIASATGLFNLAKLDWDAEVLALAGVREEQLPQPVPATHLLHGVDPQIAADWGLSPETPFVIGASDGVLANLGTDAVGEARFAVTIGTSSALRASSDRPVLDPLGRLFCYALTENVWIVGGASNNGGIVTQWTRERLYPGRPLYEVLPLAGSVPPGADGLLFLPLLTGERAPFWDAAAKGVLFGLSLTHNERHILRAAMEGVLFQIRAISDLAAGIAGRPKHIRASGGFARSPLWCGMLADMLGVPVSIPTVVESSAFGAAKLGFYAMEQPRKDLLRWQDDVGITYEPNAKNHRVYEELFPIYMGLYHRLSDSMKELSAFQTDYTRGQEG